jgi:hypothetical protein
MKSFDIKKELLNLKSIQPDAEWKISGREILACQIQNSASEELNLTLSAVIAEPRKLIRFVSQPAFAVFSILLVLVAGGGGSIYAANNSKPGDSLYIARIISEQAQLAITFNSEKKEQLGLKFANDRAITITQVLSETNSDDNHEKVEKLTGDFKKEIGLVRSKINIIKNSQNKIANTDSVEPGENKESEEVFSANLSKDDRGVQISEPNKQAEESKSGEDLKNGQTEKVETSIASSSVQEGGKIIESNADASTIVAEAEKLFDEKNYNGAYDQLQKVDNIIKNGTDNSSDSSGEVKGVSESATTSPAGK